MRNGVAPKWWTMSVVQAGELGRSLRLGGHRALGAPLVARRPHESCEQRVRARGARLELGMELAPDEPGDRKSTRLNSSHGYISYAVFCLKKKKSTRATLRMKTT